MAEKIHFNKNNVYAFFYKSQYQQAVKSVNLNFETVANFSPLFESHLSLILSKSTGIGDYHRSTNGISNQNCQTFVHFHQNLNKI
jgi:hypothetical protein